MTSFIFYAQRDVNTDIFLTLRCLVHFSKTMGVFTPSIKNLRTLCCLIFYFFLANIRPTRHLKICCFPECTNITQCSVDINVQSGNVEAYNESEKIWQESDKKRRTNIYLTSEQLQCRQGGFLLYSRTNVPKRSYLQVSGLNHWWLTTKAKKQKQKTTQQFANRM